MSNSDTIRIGVGDKKLLPKDSKYPHSRGKIAKFFLGEQAETDEFKKEKEIRRFREIEEKKLQEEKNIKEQDALFKEKLKDYGNELFAREINEVGKLKTNELSLGEECKKKLKML